MKIVEEASEDGVVVAVIDIRKPEFRSTSIKYPPNLLLPNYYVPTGQYLCVGLGNAFSKARQRELICRITSRTFRDEVYSLLTSWAKKYAKDPEKVKQLADTLL
jgi:hypothetical protein